MKTFVGTVFVVIFSLTLSVSGCVTAPPPATPKVVEKLPFSFSLQFSSKLPEYVVVARAPIDAHSRYRFNQQLEDQLKTLFLARSGNPSHPVTVSVNLQELWFDYEEIGGGKPAVSMPLVASRTLFAISEDDGGLDIPYETFKTAIARFQVEISDSSGETITFELEENFIESVMWDDMYANWPYDYHTFDRVIRGITAMVVNAVDNLLVTKFSDQ